MSNKKQQTKKEPSILLGIPDGDIEVDNDAYITKLGGLPVWLEPSKPPSSKVCVCRICRKPMYLIFQSYVPLQESPYHRVLYVWACNRRSCMRKEGSFSVIRSHVVDPAYLKAQRQKEEEKRKKEEKKKAAAAKQQQAFGNGFKLGDLWGNSAGSFGSTPATSGGFGMKKPTTTAASVVASTPFGATAAKPKDTTAQDLVQQMNELGIKDPVDTANLPQFPAHYLYIDVEKTDNYESMGIDMSRYKEYLDMEKDMLMEIDEGSNGETWQGETYEKQHLPKGVDKQFKKFTERVECAPSQCVRYEFNGKPLFYSGLRPKDQELITSPCKYCKGPRVFEFQLMPNILSILPTTEYASKDSASEAKPIDAKVKNVDAKTVLDSWNVGMEFGTILVFVCQKDCHQGSIEDVSYMEEAALIQFETD